MQRNMLSCDDAGCQDAALSWRPHSDADQHESEGLPTLESGDSRNLRRGLKSSQSIQVNPSHDSAYVVHFLHACMHLPQATLRWSDFATSQLLLVFSSVYAYSLSMSASDARRAFRGDSASYAWRWS